MSPVIFDHFGHLLSQRGLARSPHDGSMGPAHRNFGKYHTRYAYSG